TRLNAAETGNYAQEAKTKALNNRLLQAAIPVRMRMLQGLAGGSSGSSGDITSGSGGVGLASDGAPSQGGSSPGYLISPGQQAFGYQLALANGDYAGAARILSSMTTGAGG